MECLLVVAGSVVDADGIPHLPRDCFLARLQEAAGTVSIEISDG
jgi:hypothetical protein